MINNIIKDYYEENYYKEKHNSLEVNLTYAQEEKLIKKQNELFKIIQNDDSLWVNIGKNMQLALVSFIISIYMEIYFFVKLYLMNLKCYILL